MAGYDPRALAAWVRTHRPASRGGQRSDRPHAQPGDDYPDVAAAARWYLEPVDYLSMRFTGVRGGLPRVDDRGLAHRQPPPRLLAYDDELVGRAGVDGTKLPPLVATGSVIGPVRDDVAADLGLPPGVQVVAGVPDLHAAAIGSGALGHGEAHMAISTTSWISLPVPLKKTDVLHGIASIPGLDRRLPAGQQPRHRRACASSGCATTWWRRPTGCSATATRGRPLQLRRPHRPGRRVAAGRPAHDLHAVARGRALAGRRPPRARRVPQPVARRPPEPTWCGPCIEGVAYNNRWLLGYVEKFVKQRLDHIRMMGGGAVSELWCQIHADVMDRTIEQVEDPLNAQLRGAAMLAGMALGHDRQAEVRDLVGGRPHVHARPGQPAGLRPLVVRAAQAVLVPEEDVPPAQPEVDVSEPSERPVTPVPPPNPGGSEGMLSLEALRDAVAGDTVDTVVVGFTDHYGRLVGKRFDARILPRGGGRRTARTPATTCSPPTWRWSRSRATDFANWELGYGDFHLVPDLGHAAAWPSWLDRTAARAVRRAPASATDAPVDGRAALDPAPPGRRGRRARASRAMAATELEYYLFRDVATATRPRRATRASSRPAGTSRTTTCCRAPAPRTFTRGGRAGTCARSGVPVENSKGEWGLGQHELNVRYADALRWPTATSSSSSASRRSPTAWA